MRAKAVADGQQVEIPVLYLIRTAGTHAGSMSGEWKDPYKRRSCAPGKAGA